MNRAKSGDKLFLGTVFFLVIAGTFIFASASLGLLSRSDIGIQSIALKQILIGLVGGIISFTIVSKFTYKHWRPLALPIFISTIILTTLIFIPGSASRMEERVDGSIFLGFHFSHQKF